MERMAEYNKFKGKVKDEPDEWVYGYLLSDSRIWQTSPHTGSKCCGVGVYYVESETIVPEMEWGSRMTDIEALCALEIMTVDFTELITDMRKKNPLYDVVKQRIDAINLAHSTIKERMERENECEWCSCFANDPNHCFSEGNGMYKTIQYNFCPMCGRRLETAD